jgi:hypothetical protein
MVTNLGRIWSVVQQNFLGAVEVYKLTPKQERHVPSLQKIFTHQTEAKLTCSLEHTASKTLLLGENTGRISLLSLSEGTSTTLVVSIDNRRFQELKS